MNRLLLAVLALLALATVVLGSISCYLGEDGVYISTSGWDACYSWTTNGVPYKYGVSGVSCSSGVPSNYTCCSTNLCNSAKINGVSILIVSIVAMPVLFQAM